MVGFETIRHVDDAKKGQLFHHALLYSCASTPPQVFSEKNLAFIYHILILNFSDR